MNISIFMRNLQTKPHRIPYVLKRALLVRLEFHIFSPNIKRKTPIAQRKKPYWLINLIYIQYFCCVNQGFQYCRKGDWVLFISSAWQLAIKLSLQHTNITWCMEHDFKEILCNMILCSLVGIRIAEFSAKNSSIFWLLLDGSFSNILAKDEDSRN